MKPPIFVRRLTGEEHAQLEGALRSSDAFTLRRAQIVLASARGQTPKSIALALGCSAQTVRNAIHAFNQAGSARLNKQSTRPKRVHPVLDAAKCERLKQIMHQSPRTFGKNTSLWTLALVAEVAYEQGLTEQVLSDETIRRAMKRLGASWRRAKQWITSPDPQYARKKSGVTA